MSPHKSRHDLVLENLVLRHQIAVLERTARRRLWAVAALGCYGTSRYPAAMAPGDAKYHRPLNVFFDVDGTLITWDNRIRPHVHDVFQQLKDDGHAIYIWSGIGVRTEVVERHDLHDFISGLYGKPLYSFRDRLHLFTPVAPDFVIDDYPEIVSDLGGVQIRPPVWPMTDDREMWRVYEAFVKHVRRVAERESPLPPHGAGPPGLGPA